VTAATRAPTPHERASATSADVAVLGAGPAGLGAALRLARAGRSVVVLEQEPHVGGLAASVVVGGQRVDLGSHRLHAATDPEVLGLLQGLLGDDLQWRRRQGRIRLFDRWLAFPLRPGDLVRALPPQFLARAGASAAAAAVRPRRDATFADVVASGLGTAMGEAFYFPYAEKIWGVPAHELAGLQARRRISAGSPGRLLRRVLRPAPRAAGGAGGFWYPAGGFGRIPEVLADAATAAGADLRTGARVAGLRADADGVVVTTASGGGVRVGTVLSTLPLPVLARLLTPTAPPPALPSRAMVLVYLVLDVPRWTPYDAHYLPGPGTPMTRVSEPGNYRTPTSAWPDPSGTTVLCAELPCAVDDAVWRADDDALVALVIDGLEAVGLGRPPVLEAAVRRRRNAYPVYRVGVEPVLEATLAAVEQHPRVRSFGRQGLFAHDNTHHALAMAWAAAAVIRPDGTVDAAAWAAHRARFAEHVVED
jgi:protoporphyrinogen oxidase